MAKALTATSIRPDQNDWIVVGSTAGSRRFWLDLECDNWSDGVLLVEVELPGGGPRREIARIPAAGMGGPFDCAMAQNIVLSMATTDSAATEASVSVVAE